MDIIFSGVQPTGNLHIGNYLGAIKNFVEIQKRENIAKSYYCVVDLHAITVWQNPQQLRKDILETAACFIAAGIDPNKSIIFNQSRVSCHAELAWILNCICRIGWLNRMTQFKEKAGKNKEKVSVGLYTYPVLMAADILSYKANLVPVGDDQKQHLELTRDIAQKFNRDFNCEDFFPIPEPIIDKNISRIMSLKDGSQKMSKSDLSEYSRISLLDESDEIIKKIKKAKTADSVMPGKIEEVQKLAEVNNLLNIYSGFSEIEKHKLVEQYEGQNFSKFKSDLSDVLVERLNPITKEVKKLMQDIGYLSEILLDGQNKANQVAQKTINDVYDIVGLHRNGA